MFLAVPESEFDDADRILWTCLFIKCQGYQNDDLLVACLFHGRLCLLVDTETNTTVLSLDTQDVKREQRHILDFFCFSL